MQSTSEQVVNAITHNQ